MNRHDVFWINGKSIESVSAANRGLEFGDGIFETIRYHRGKLVALECHLKRLSIGLESLFFPNCLSKVRSDLDAVLDHLCRSHAEDMIVRVTVTRGKGLRGYGSKIPSMPTVIVRASASLQNPRLQGEPMHVELANLQLSIQPSLAGIKHLNRLEQVLASVEKQKRGVDELLMMDLEGVPTCFIAGNLFIREGENLYTPMVNLCGIEGTRRSLILSTLGTAARYSVFESPLSIKRVFSADELIFCNTVAGIRSIKTLGSVEWGDYSAANALHRAYLKECLN